MQAWTDEELEVYKDAKADGCSNEDIVAIYPNKTLEDILELSAFLEGCSSKSSAEQETIAETPIQINNFQSAKENVKHSKNLRVPKEVRLAIERILHYKTEGGNFKTAKTKVLEEQGLEYATFVKLISVYFKGEQHFKAYFEIFKTVPILTLEAFNCACINLHEELKDKVKSGMSSTEIAKSYDVSIDTLYAVTQAEFNNTTDLSAYYAKFSTFPKKEVISFESMAEKFKEIGLNVKKKSVPISKVEVPKEEVFVLNDFKDMSLFESTPSNYDENAVLTKYKSKLTMDLYESVLGIKSGSINYAYLDYLLKTKVVSLAMGSFLSKLKVPNKYIPLILLRNKLISAEIFTESNNIPYYLIEDLLLKEYYPIVGNDFFDVLRYIDALKPILKTRDYYIAKAFELNLKCNSHPSVINDSILGVDKTLIIKEYEQSGNITNRLTPWFTNEQCHFILYNEGIVSNNTKSFMTKESHEYLRNRAKLRTSYREEIVDKLIKNTWLLDWTWSYAMDEVLTNRFKKEGFSVYVDLEGKTDRDVIERAKLRNLKANVSADEIKYKILPAALELGTLKGLSDIIYWRTPKSIDFMLADHGLAEYFLQSYKDMELKYKALLASVNHLEPQLEELYEPKCNDVQVVGFTQTLKEQLQDTIDMSELQQIVYEEEKEKVRLSLQSELDATKLYDILYKEEKEKAIKDIRESLDYAELRKMVYTEAEAKVTKTLDYKAIHKKFEDKLELELREKDGGRIYKKLVAKIEKEALDLYLEELEKYSSDL